MATEHFIFLKSEINIEPLFLISQELRFLKIWSKHSTPIPQIPNFFIKDH